MEEPIDWKGLLLACAIIGFLLWLFPGPQPGDKIPLTPPESLYAPRGSVQIIGE